MTTPPMPPGYRTHDPVAKSFQHTVEQHSQDDSGSFTVTNVVMGLVDGLSTSLYNAAPASVLDPLSSVANMVGIADFVAAERKDVLVSQYPIADRAMLLLSVLVKLSLLLLWVWLRLCLLDRGCGCSCGRSVVVDGFVGSWLLLWRWL